MEPKDQQAAEGLADRWTRPDPPSIEELEARPTGKDCLQTLSDLFGGERDEALAEQDKWGMQFWEAK